MFARIRIEHVEKNSKNRELEVERNTERSKLRLAMIECLAAVLEGVIDELIPLQMLALLNWEGIVEQMEANYHSYERCTDFPKDMCLKEAMQYYFLLKHIKNYDKGNEYISPALADISHKMQQFFEDRLGYIEIVRDGRLERCYFQIPDACAPGGELSRKPFDEMFSTDQREEFDAKSKDYLQNMMHIVEKVQFHDKIRNSPLAFTVKQWDLIRQINFMWTFSLHVLLVIGGYMPAAWKEHYRARIELAEFAFIENGDRRNFEDVDRCKGKNSEDSAL